jgi:hypothetical protein
VAAEQYLPTWSPVDTAEVIFTSKTSKIITFKSGIDI